MVIQVLILLFLLFLPTEASHSCCIAKGVSKKCADELCHTHKPPSDMSRYSLFDDYNSCTDFIKPISECLTNGRDSRRCCQAEAIQPDDSSCFGMCDSSVEVNGAHNFQSCFAVNADAIYSCIHKSHSDSPSPPENLRINKEGTSVEFIWDPPAHQQSSLHIYKLSLVKINGRSRTTTVHDTKETSLKLVDLSKTSSYSAFVISHGKIHHSDPDYNRSLRSNMVSFSLEPEIPLSSHVVKIHRERKLARLSCVFSTAVPTRPIVEWRKRTGGEFKRVDEAKFKSTAYQSNLDSETIVASLQIQPMRRTDFGVYRAYLGKNFCEVKLEQHSHVHNPLPNDPPKTTYECCSEVEQRENCKSVCSDKKANHRLSLLPGQFLPQMRCTDEFNILLKCSISEMDNLPCCIHHEVPFHCLGMCDPDFKIVSTKGICFPWLDKVMKCQNEIRMEKPAAVSHINASNLGSNNYFTWAPSKKAITYHIYWRTNQGPWIRKIVEGTSATVPSSDEVVLLAVNHSGRSAQHRLHLIDGMWSESDY